MPYEKIQNWLACRTSKSEQDIIDEINEKLHAFGFPKHYLSLLDPLYNHDIDVTNYSKYEKCILLREVATNDRGQYSGEVINELNYFVHINDALAIGINVFEFPLISRTLLDAINAMPTTVTLEGK